MKWLALALFAGLAAASCAFTRLDDVSCPDGGTSLTYDNFGQPFFATWCNSCHSAAVEYRHGAPEQFVFDTQARVQNWKSRIFERAAADNDSMPPGPDGPSRKERDQLAVWLACGAQ
jgi:uncharacterized membrane protein